VVGDDLHGEVRLPISRAALDGCTDTGSVLRVDPVHVERDVVTDGAATRESKRLFHHRAHATFVDVAHRERMNAGTAHVLFFMYVNIADTNQHAVLRRDLRTPVVDIGQLGRTEAHDRAKRHPVHVPAGRRPRRIDVAVRVEPDQPNLLVLAAVKLGQP
jgi:hypothetical protein